MIGGHFTIYLNGHGRMIMIDPVREFWRCTQDAIASIQMPRILDVLIILDPVGTIGSVIQFVAASHQGNSFIYSTVGTIDRIAVECESNNRRMCGIVHLVKGIIGPDDFLIFFNNRYRPLHSSVIIAPIIIRSSLCEGV